jgi:hypothetical protein
MTLHRFVRALLELRILRPRVGGALALVCLCALLCVGLAAASPHASNSIITLTAATPAAKAVKIALSAYLPLVESSGGCSRPYSASSPWNTPIGPQPDYDPLSSVFIAAFSGDLASDPTQYTMPVYAVDAFTPQRTIVFSGVFSEVVGDTQIVNQRQGIVQAPMPDNAVAGAGDDGQIILWNRQTGDEWGFSDATPNGDGSWSASNGYHYHTSWDGVPPVGAPHFSSRGAGVPFLAGLVRPCEIARSQIDHALAFAYNFPTGEFVPPATKSDGSNLGLPYLPEGARLQLDPGLTDAHIRAWGCDDACLTIAHAMQQYGFIVIDKSNRPKIFVEYEATAQWNGLVEDDTISNIPYTAFKVLRLSP